MATLFTFGENALVLVEQRDARAPNGVSAEPSSTISTPRFRVRPDYICAAISAGRSKIELQMHPLVAEVLYRKLAQHFAGAPL